MELQGPNGTKFVISFTSKRQGATSRSSCEAEIAAADYVVRKEHIPVSYLLDYILEARRGPKKEQEVDPAIPPLMRPPPPHPPRSIPLHVWEDNAATLLILQGLTSKEMRHVSRTHEIHIAFLQETLKKGGVVCAHVISALQKADFLTKEFLEGGTNGISSWI